MRTEKNKKAVQFLRALAHPTRMEIVRELLIGKKCVSRIEGLLKIRQPNISQHLSILKSAGIADFKQEGKQKCYFLKKIKTLKKILNALK